MYGSLRHEIRIHRSAADVWALACDATKLHTWFPGIVDSTVDGNMRVITMGTGLPMPEEILLIDHTQRRFQYRITAPIFVHHRGTIDVIELADDECLVVYSTEADPRTMALVIAGGTAGALVELKRQMEAPALSTEGAN
jgi:uncharacterized protein YndB with AHSA1/START domain